jgi:hypothetical protein
MAAHVVSPRTREGQQLPAEPLDDFVRRLAEQAATPKLSDPTATAPSNFPSHGA